MVHQVSAVLDYEDLKWNSDNGKIERNRDTVHCTVYFYGVKEKLTKNMERRKEREILCSPYENIFLKHFFKDFPFLLTASGICDTVSQEQK